MRPLAQGRIEIVLRCGYGEDACRFSHADAQLAGNIAADAGGSREFAADQRDHPGCAFVTMVVQDMFARHRAVLLPRLVGKRTDSGEAVTYVGLGGPRTRE